MKKLPAHKKPHEMTQIELEQENERLENLLQAGELSIKESRRLEKVREGLVQLEMVKGDHYLKL